MKNIFLTMASGLLIGSSLFAAGNAATLAARCAQDNLAPGPAKQRSLWAYKCAKNNGGNWAGFSKNKFYSLVYEIDSETMVKSERARPEYPIFTTANMSQVWIAPVNQNAGCKIEAGYSITGFCTSSCYTGDQQILFADGYLEIEKALSLGRTDVAVVTEDSEIGNVNLRLSHVETYTKSIKEDSINQIRKFSTESGEDLVVTTNHPLVDGEGKLVRAETLKVGDSLVDSYGNPVEITAIEDSEYRGPVFNIQPVVEQLEIGQDSVKGQLVVAQGYLSGSSHLQNDGEVFMGSYLLRANIPEELLN